MRIGFWSRRSRGGIGAGTADLISKTCRLLQIWVCALAVIGTLGAASETPVPKGSSEFQGALDRLGVPYQVPRRGKAILVNIPAFELIAFEDGLPTLRSRVIVGTSWNPTPLLETTTKTVRFRPTWRPTRSMIASGEYRDRIWPPGPQNPLGLAAIRFAAQIPIYLHDTNRRDLFDREVRALSHGCIRVERWDILVAWTLDMDLSEVHRLANGPATLDVATPAIPVRVGYFLTFPDATGAPVTYDDVYGRGVGQTSGGSDLPRAQFACSAHDERDVR
ncbi:L,D-transpeptidase family protein [Roseobacter weihaiensis]|uniref:L,D-transpeptidase family protein n=1 Tax=Roseobacter weihaiensis TaxID=2763262 RepID=UPI001D0B13A3|nr:L,D-transpeptidase family protein [Roseobacter sp. H9]